MEVSVISIKSAKGKESGWVNTVTKTYYTPRNQSHFMRMFDGFGISEDILLQLAALEVKLVCIIYENNSHTEKVYYRCELAKFLKSDKIYNNIKDEILDPQRFVGIQEMQKENK
jgi:hypothetical protein